MQGNDAPDSFEFSTTIQSLCSRIHRAVNPECPEKIERKGLAVGAYERRVGTGWCCIDQREARMEGVPIQDILTG
jgi:hypothetical protein